MFCMLQVPIQKKLIDQSQLSQDEVKWLNDYHATVLEKLTPHFDAEKEPEAFSFLQESCSPL